MPAVAPEAPGLPTRFPCWCRAVYSWGGETKRDLGFVEGDLIECLNAGDGSWWMGRLRRDKRMIGLFPSNFVQVLDDSFRPASRARSPMVPDGGGIMSRAASPRPLSGGSRGPSPQPPQSAQKPFRKPFAAYSRAASPNPAAVRRDDSAASRTPSRKASPSPMNVSRQSYYLPNTKHNEYYLRRGPSPAPLHHSRAPSPAQSAACFPESHSRGPSPHSFPDIGSSPPPPPPPPHRVPYRSRPVTTDESPYQDYHTRLIHTSRPASAAPQSPNAGHTPSPLRDAMDDVLSSLQDMSMQPRGSLPCREPSPVNVWSPEAFGQHVSQAAPRSHNNRAQSSLGFGDHSADGIVDEYHESESDGEHGSHQIYRPLSPGQGHDGPQLSNYVQRMESRLRGMQLQQEAKPEHAHVDLLFPEVDPMRITMGPPRVMASRSRPTSAMDRNRPGAGSTDSSASSRRLRGRKSAYELGRQMLGRTFTIQSSATNSSSGVQSTTTNGSHSTQMTSQSVMSGHSAGGFSATSAGSLARRRGGYGSSVTNGRPMTVLGTHGGGYIGSHTGSGMDRPQTPLTGVTYHSSHDSRAGGASQAGPTGSIVESGGILGGMMAPRPRKSGFFKKIIESAKTGAASARSSIAAGQAVQPASPVKSMLPHGVTAIAGGSNVAREMGLGGDNVSVGGIGVDWVQVRRDVNRSNSLSLNERIERRERCQMMEYSAIPAVDIFHEFIEGDERADGQAVAEPMNFQTSNLGLVDKSARFINSLPPMTNPASLAQGYVCRPYRNDLQRLRSIFTWVSEKISWEADFEGEVDTRRVIQLKRGCAEEVAVLVMEMCQAVGIHAEVIRGHLKVPGEVFEAENGVPPPNHWWNAVVVDTVWRIMDCSLASPTNPKRAQYSSTNSQYAESWWCLPRPMEICYSHVPMIPAQQHLCPPIHHEVLMALPCASPPYFKVGLQMLEYDTSGLRIEGLELVHITFAAPSDIECVAEVETRALEFDQDGDRFENGEVVKKRALAQAEWLNGQKRYTVKALLPGDAGQGTLKVYAGKRGLMHSIKDIPHPLAFSLPIVHTGLNPPYDFLTRHPTPHAQRHDLYVAQPQCARLAVNNTFVFAVRQHPSSLSGSSAAIEADGRTSPVPPPIRPVSAMSMISSSAAGSNPSTNFSSQKPAKLAIQAPSGKILRLMRKSEHMIGTSAPGSREIGDGGVWETIIKCGERGTWRGLVLADRSARWCVFAEWTCV